MKIHETQMCVCVSAIKRTSKPNAHSNANKDSRKKRKWDRGIDRSAMNEWMPLKNTKRVKEKRRKRDLCCLAAPTNVPGGVSECAVLLRNNTIALLFPLFLVSHLIGRGFFFQYANTRAHTQTHIKMRNRVLVLKRDPANIIYTNKSDGTFCKQ